MEHPFITQDKLYSKIAELEKKLAIAKEALDLIALHSVGDDDFEDYTPEADIAKNALVKLNE